MTVVAITVSSDIDRMVAVTLFVTFVFSIKVRGVLAQASGEAER